MRLDNVLQGSKISICDAVEFDLGHNDDSVWQARLRMHRAHFSWQAQYFVDLDKKVAESCVKRRFLTFSMFRFRGARGVVKV